MATKIDSRSGSGERTTASDGRWAVRRAFVVARLLTGSLEAAEHAVMHAIEEWDPDAGAEDLLRLAVRAAKELRDRMKDRAQRLSDSVFPGLDAASRRRLLCG